MELERWNFNTWKRSPMDVYIEFLQYNQRHDCNKQVTAIQKLVKMYKTFLK